MVNKKAQVISTPPEISISKERGESSTSKKKILIVGGIIFFLIILILSFKFLIPLFFVKESKDPFTNSVEVCMDHGADIACLAFIRADPTICDSIDKKMIGKTDASNQSVQEARTQCRRSYYSEKFLENLDTLSCEEIPLTEVKNVCFEFQEGKCNIWYSLEGYVPSEEVKSSMCKALQSKDPSICDSLNEIDNLHCLNFILYTLALSQKDLSYLEEWEKVNEELEGARIKHTLRAMVTGNETLCYPSLSLCEKNAIDSGFSPPTN